MEGNVTTFFVCMCAQTHMSAHMCVFVHEQFCFILNNPSALQSGNNLIYIPVYHGQGRLEFTVHGKVPYLGKSSNAPEGWS